MQNQVRINGPVSAVFDLITSARFWPLWHPYSRGVAGVTERPYQLGDLIYEHVACGKYKILEFRWQVIEHIRPRRVVLEASHRQARLSYDFAADGPGVLFTRVLEMPAYEAKGDQALLHGLKVFIENILRAETHCLE